MTQKNLRPKATVPLLALIVVALVLVVIHGAILLDRISINRDADVDNRTWLVAQLEVDHKELRLALLKAQNQPLLTAEAERAVRRTFDIYYSRVLTVAAALHSANSTETKLRHLRRIESSRDEMAGLMDAVAFLMPQDILRLDDISRQDAGVIRDITSAAILTFTQLAAANRLEHRDILIRLGGLMAVLFILMAVAVMLAIRISREAASRAGSAARTASNLRRTFEASLDGVIVSDAAGTITYLNAAALRMFGQSPTDLLGASIIEMILPGPANDRETSAMRLVRGDSPGQLVDNGRHRMTGLHRSGHEFPIEVSIVSDHDSDGQFVCIGFFRDITADVEAETKLRDARDKARHDAAAKSRFLAVMSHEMRTPLHGVLAALDLIGTDKLSATDRRFLATARACGLSALDQVDEVLEVTRSGAAEVTVSAFNPERLAAELLADLQPLARERGNHLTLKPPAAGPCPDLLGWRRGFLLVMRNLISNAVKFTSHGEITVSLSCTSLPGGQLALNVAVSDTGVGIDPADHERVFDEFEALDTGNRGGTSGVGLGLAIARSAVERMGGKITLQSTPGLGSRFSFRLILDIAPASLAAEPAGPPTPDTSLPPPATAARRVLVVDDNPVNLALMAEMLRRLGHQPETAQDGPRAIALARDEAFDLILMDINMPGMDGITTTRAIRAFGASAFCPVVGVTALVLEEDRPRILDAGMQDVLGKPLGLAQLRTYLTEFFDDHLPPDEDDEGYNEVRALMGDKAMLHLLQDVLQDAETALAALRAADATQDLPALQQILHRATGSAAVVGATALAEALRKGERAIIAGDLTALKTCEAEITAKIVRTRDHTQTLAQDRSPVTAP